MMHNPIPESVLEKILQHRPDLAEDVSAYRAAQDDASRYFYGGKIADLYLAGTTRLTALETWRLSSLVVGPEGGGYGQTGRPASDLPGRPDCPTCGVPMVADGTNTNGARKWLCKTCRATRTNPTGRPVGRPRKLDTRTHME